MHNDRVCKIEKKNYLQISFRVHVKNSAIGKYKYKKKENEALQNINLWYLSNH